MTTISFYWWWFIPKNSKAPWFIIFFPILFMFCSLCNFSIDTTLWLQVYPFCSDHVCGRTKWMSMNICINTFDAKFGCNLLIDTTLWLQAYPFCSDHVCGRTIWINLKSINICINTYQLDLLEYYDTYSMNILFKDKTLKSKIFPPLFRPRLWLHYMGMF